MKPAVIKRMQAFQRFHILGFACLALILAGCGGSSTPTQTTTTGLKKRVLLSNQFGSAVNILDAQNDKIASTVQVASPDKMVTAGGITAIIENGLNNITVINNASETVVQSPALAARAEDIAVSSDGKIIFVAVHNAGTVDFITSDGTINTVNVPSVSRLVVSPNGSKLLAFSDSPTNTFTVIDVGTRTATAITDPTLDQPFTAVFNGSETQAFILDCGAECGGIAAGVSPVNFGVSPAVVGTKIPVSGATVGLISGSSLFVAGTPPGSSTGTLQTINTGSLAVTAPISIPNGLHQRMRLSSNNRLYVGSRTCSGTPDPANSAVHGCLAIVDTGSGTVVVPEQPSIRGNFDVTSILPITNRNVMYVVEGGELDIFDITTNALTPTQIDIQGKAIDVVQIDP